jgi:hypothetical protein
MRRADLSLLPYCFREPIAIGAAWKLGTSRPRHWPTRHAPVLGRGMARQRT